MGTKKFEYIVNRTSNLSIVEKSKDFSTKTLINSLIPNFKIKNSSGKQIHTVQAII